MERKKDVFRLFTVPAALVVSILLSCDSPRPSASPGVRAPLAPKAPSATTPSPPPLIIDMDAPLLLDEPTEAEEVSTSGKNTACLVCHANYTSEALAVRHAEANVGCVNCHGESFAHKNDENNTTPPETMFPTDRIDSFCRGCHTTHDVSPREIVARWLKRGSNKADPGELACTDCHGNHRMRVRTVIWDKTSGKLLRTNKGD